MAYLILMLLRRPITHSRLRGADSVVFHGPVRMRDVLVGKNLFLGCVALETGVSLACCLEDGSRASMFLSTIAAATFAVWDS